MIRTAQYDDATHKIVPRVATEEMLDKFLHSCTQTDYAEMLAAAPDYPYVQQEPFAYVVRDNENRSHDYFTKKDSADYWANIMQEESAGPNLKFHVAPLYLHPLLQSEADKRDAERYKYLKNWAFAESADDRWTGHMWNISGIHDVE